VLSALPELAEDHPLLRPDRAATFLAVMKSLPARSGQVLAIPGADQEPAEGEKTDLLPVPAAHHEPAVGDQTIIRPKLSIGSVAPESAKIYAFLDIEQDERVVQRIAIKESQVVVGRLDPKRGITPEIDLTPFDVSSKVSRRHARIRLDNTHVSIEDLHSRNKTRLGELTLTPHRPEALHNGDVISFGSVKATFRLLGTSELPVPWTSQS
jgi:hypothetical protein